VVGRSLEALARLGYDFTRREISKPLPPPPPRRPPLRDSAALTLSLFPSVGARGTHRESLAEKGPALSAG
jgi:hypothetical protein